MNSIEISLQPFLKFLDKSQNIVVFTGAGISTESGISDYRSQGGLWDRYQPVTYQEFLSSKKKRTEYWKRKIELYRSMTAAQPNPAHHAIKNLDDKGFLRGLITQNIDGLHESSGLNSTKILNIHGTNCETICLECKDITTWQESFRRLEEGEESLLCLKCGGLLKPNTISFGQNLNDEILNTAVYWSQKCDLMIVIGSTLLVEPARFFTPYSQTKRI